MRYMVALMAIGKRWQALMRERGVPEATIESWGIYWDQLSLSIGTCKVSDLSRIGSQMATSFSTALYYMEKGGIDG